MNPDSSPVPAKPMRLLLLTETIPYPLDTGGRIKTFNTLQILSARHEVHCHALVHDVRHLRFEENLRPHCASVTLHSVFRSYPREALSLASSLATRLPFVVGRHFHRRILRRLQAACQQHRFDAIYCDHLSMMEYGRRLGLPIVLDAHNVEFEIIRRYAATLGWSPLRAFAELEWHRLRQYERRWYPQCRLIFSVSDIDARTIREMAGARVPVVTIPIAIDARAAPVIDELVAAPEILFVGGFHWPPNTDAVTFFIQEILPHVRGVVPDARLTVVGRNYEQVVKRTGTPTGVRFAGHVDDVELYFRRSRVMVVPIRSGSGMRVKILDALARGLPTVATSVGCEGIDIRIGADLLVADDPVDFAAQVVRLLTDRPLAESLAKAGRLLALRAYDKSVVASRICDAVEGHIRTAPPNSAPSRPESSF
jgi:glycosyltransferase involved in cell wall biosynthesis